jgi:hypothetical protein
MSGIRKLALAQVGWYATVCCILDLRRIKDREDLDHIREDECDWQLWPTLDEAIADLRPHQPSWGPDEDRVIQKLRDEIQRRGIS